MEPSSADFEPPVSVARAGKRSQEHWILLFGSLGALVVFVVLALWIRPDPRGFGTHEQLGLPACKMMEWTGIPCPGCGVTTSVALFGHGRFLAALHNQPLGFLVGIAIPVCAAWTSARHWMGRDLAHDLKFLGLRSIVIAGLTVIALCWLYKLALVKGWIA
jgi:hypothetical protein